MGKILVNFFNAIGGHTGGQNDWIPATALRPLIHHDTALAWLAYHGTENGFEQDPEDPYSFLAYIGQKGRDFEDAWVKNPAGSRAVQSLDESIDVRRAKGLRTTLELMDRRTEVIAKAALWWAPEAIYGSSICSE